MSGRGNNSKKNKKNDDYKSTALEALTSTLPSIKSQRQYPLRLKPFFDIARIQGKSIGERADKFVKQARDNPKWAYDILIEYVNHGKQRVNIKKDLAAGTLKTVFNTIQLFYEYNDLGVIGTPVPINWKRIKRGLPRGITKANDRSYTVEEIHKLVEHCNRRMKVIVYILCSSGIRAGALADLRLKHIIPITNPDNDNDIIAAKLIAYYGEPEQCFTFITPEAYNILQEYIEYRREHGERITDDSLVIRDQFKTKDVKFAAKAGLATNPQPLSAESIEKTIGRELRAQGVRGALPKGQRRHEYKAAHGLRKFFTNKLHSAGIQHDVHKRYLSNVELKIEGNYWKPQEHEQELLNDYLKAVPLLTISSQRTAQLQHKVMQLTIRSEEQQSIIDGRMAEMQQIQEKQEEEISNLRSIALRLYSKLGVEAPHIDNEIIKMPAPIANLETDIHRLRSEKKGEKKEDLMIY